MDTYQQVKYGIYDERTKKVTPFDMEYPQKFTKKDLAGFNRILGASGKSNFVLYEQKTNYVLRDEKGAPVIGSKGQKLRQYKLSPGSTKAETRPILFSGGKRRRATDVVFRKRSPRELVDATQITSVKEFNVWHRDIRFTGETLAETVKNIQVDLSKEEIKRHNIDTIFYNVVLKIKGRDPIIINESMPVYVNYTHSISRSIRFSLANKGLRFTSLFVLNNFAAAADDPDPLLEIPTRSGVLNVEQLDPLHDEFEGRDTQSRKKSDMVSMDILFRAGVSPFEKPKRKKKKPTKGKKK